MQRHTLDKREHFDRLPTRLMAWLARAIPLDRTRDVVPTLEAGLRALQQGRILLIHPEGTRTRSGRLGTFRRGAARLALATATPLVPVRISGAYGILPCHRRLPRLLSGRGFLRRAKLHVAFGVPLQPPQGVDGPQAEAELTRRLQGAVETLARS